MVIEPHDAAVDLADSPVPYLDASPRAGWSFEYDPAGRTTPTAWNPASSWSRFLFTLRGNNLYSRFEPP